MEICFISSSSSSKSAFNNTMRQMRSSVNIQPHQCIAALCYSIWKSSLLLQSLPSWHFTGNKKSLSWHSLFTCSALHSWIKQQEEYSNSEDRFNESSKLEDCRGKQIEFCQSLFKQETYLCSEGAMYVRCLQEGQDFPYFFQLQITSPLLVQTLINTEHQMDRRNTFPSISQKRFLNFFWSGHSFCLMLQDAKPVTCLNHKNPFLLPWQ